MKAELEVVRFNTADVIATSGESSAACPTPDKRTGQYKAPVGCQTGIG